MIILRKNKTRISRFVKRNPLAMYSYSILKNIFIHSEFFKVRTVKEHTAEHCKIIPLNQDLIFV